MGRSFPGVALALYTFFLGCRLQFCGKQSFRSVQSRSDRSFGAVENLGRLAIALLLQPTKDNGCSIVFGQFENEHVEQFEFVMGSEDGMEVPGTRTQSLLGKKTAPF